MTSLARFGIPAAKAAVRLQNVYRLLFYQFAKPPTMPLHLSCGDRYLRMCTQVCQRTRIILVQRLLKPGDVAVFDRAAEKFSLYRVEQIIGIDHEVNAGTYGVTDFANAN